MTNKTAQPNQSATANLYRRALEVLPGGASRSTILRRPHPLYAAFANGCKITDIDQVERLDFANNMTSLIHGHNRPEIVAATSEQLSRGTAHTLATEIEIRLAEHLCQRIDGVDQVCFFNSGTEAVMTAIKLARAFTGRPKLAKTEGSYHGAYDYAEVSQTPTPKNWGDPDRPASIPSSRGVPKPVLDDVLILPFNDIDASLEILNQNPQDLACLLLDVLPHRGGLYPAEPDYVAALADWARRHDVLLIADEVITFRNGWGGSWPAYGCQPDLIALGKIIGGGFPVGAVAGRAEVMALLNPHGDRYLLPHAGTFSANPITLTAGLTALELFDQPAVERLNQLGQKTRQRLSQLIEAKGWPLSVTGAGSLFRIHLQESVPKNYREAYLDPSQKTRQTQLFDAFLQRGILLIYSLAGSLSTPMGEAEIDQLVAAAAESFDQLFRG